MEKKGIITGIGNQITPQIDALINQYIVGLGKNTIIYGMELEQGTLKAGMCFWCGYRGMLDTDITGITENYIYGKFYINFKKDSNGNYIKDDEFSIVTTNEEITPNSNYNDFPPPYEEGWYYLLLYEKDSSENYIKIVPTENPYPQQAYISDRSIDLIAGGTIDSTATTDTASVNTHNTQPERVANTEYVHHQIVEELDEDTITFDLVGADGYGGTKNYGTMSIQRRARYCIATVNIPLPITVYNGALGLGVMPSGYIPYNDVLSSVCSSSSTGARAGQIQLNNEITLVNIPYSTDNESTDYLEGRVQKGTYIIGYECKQGE